MSVNRELSEREREILSLVATGASNKEIAHRLAISVNTTKVHIRNIFAKLGVGSRTEATLCAIREGLVEHPAAITSPPEPKTLSRELTVSMARPAIPWQRWAIAPAIAIPLIAILFFLSSSFQQQPQIASASPPALSASTRWKARASMPTPRASLAVAVYDNEIYAIGGEGAKGVSAANERYDTVNDTWEQLAPKPTAVSEVSAAAIRGRLYVPGGRLASGDVTNAVEVYDPSTNMWESRAALPMGLSAYALVAFEGKLYVFGGWDSQHYVPSVYEYDPEGDAWRKRSALPTARGFAAAAVADGKIFVLGGFDGRQALATNERYSPDHDDGVQNPWVPRRALLSPRFAIGAASVADFIYVIGGKSDGSTQLTSLQYLYESDSWNSFEGPTSQDWSSMGLAPVQTLLYAVGGRLSGDFSNRTSAYQAIFTILLPSQP